MTIISNIDLVFITWQAHGLVSDIHDVNYSSSVSPTITNPETSAISGRKMS